MDTSARIPTSWSFSRWVSAATILVAVLPWLLTQPARAADEVVTDCSKEGMP